MIWLLLGFESTWGQLKVYQDHIFQILSGQITLYQVDQLSKQFYGADNHWSAPVIYGIAFWYLSIHLESVGIKKSLNFISTTILTLMNVGIFETFWNRSYAYFQNQPWAISLSYKQGTNIMMFSLWIIIGALTLVYLYAEGYRFKITRFKLLMCVAAIALCVLWITYPGPVKHIEVYTDWGIWTNTDFFPQTFYAVDLANDGIALGFPFFVEDYWIHFLNTLCKVVVTGAILGLFMVGPRIYDKD